MGKYMKNS